MTGRPFDSQAMAREIVLAHSSYYSINAPRAVYDLDGVTVAIAAALQSLHDAHEVEVRGLREKLDKATAEERFRDHAHRNG